MPNRPIIAGTRKITAAYFNNQQYTGAFLGDDNFIFKKISSGFDISVDDYGGVVIYKDNPIGVIGVPSSVTGDDSIRIISIFNMNPNLPEAGTTSDDTLKCPDESFLKYKALFTGPYVDNNNSLNSYSPPFVDGWHDHSVLIQLSDNSGLAGDWRTADAVPNSSARNRGYAPAALCAWRYNPISSVLDMKGYWYLPSLHELIEEGLHLSAIDAGMTTIKTEYDIGLGRVPYSTQVNNSPNSYYGSRYIGSQTGWGGNQTKYNVKYLWNRSQYYATSADSGMAQAWCKLIKDNRKWILDPEYHIN